MIPIAAPLELVAVHVVQSPGVGRITAGLGGSLQRRSGVRPVRDHIGLARKIRLLAIQRCTERSCGRGSRPAGVFPLRFRRNSELPLRRQVTRRVRQLGQLTAEPFDDAEGFCRKLTELSHTSGDLPAEWEFRIPTEAQWEYACRAGTTTATSFGATLDRKQANFAGKPYVIPDGPDAGPSLKRATKAGSYPANAWGLHDMHGNEFEWCRDWYHTKLPGGVDPDLCSVQGTRNRDGTYSRARRGGSWGDDGWACRSALRLRYEPHRGADHIGFRVVAARL